MVILICFDLPRDSKEKRKQATKFRKQLIKLGFSMKQFSIYERYAYNQVSIDNVLDALEYNIPKEGKIVLYSLPNEIHNEQLIILGSDIIYKPTKKPQIIYL